MSKSSSVFVCQSCGTTTSKWSGRCDGCGAWNTIIEEAREAPASGAKGKPLPRGRVSKLVGLKGESAAPPRIVTGMPELDRVAGGGFVPGSAVLIGGDPGIGKSTLLLQAMASTRATASFTFQAKKPLPKSACALNALALLIHPCCSLPKPTRLTSLQR
jgi:DNA repair protein RadA/Sms